MRANQISFCRMKKQDRSYVYPIKTNVCVKNKHVLSVTEKLAELASVQRPKLKQENINT